jgi:hypothetical protein
MPHLHMKQHNVMRFLHLLTVALALLATPASAAVVTIIADIDTAIFAQSPDNNFGVSDLIAGTNAGGFANARSLLKFNVSASIPAGSTINSVTFRVGVIRQSNLPVSSSYQLHRLLKNWNEGVGGFDVNLGSPALPGETTWNSEFHGATLWAVPGGLAATDYVSAASGVGPVINAKQIYEIASTANLVADVQTWINTPATNNGWIFIASSEGVAGTARRFSSTEVPGFEPAFALTPRIVVDYTAPAPAAAVPALPLWGIILMGVLLLIFTTRRSSS